MGEHADSLPLLTAEAVAAQEQGDWATALAWWEQIAASFPDDPAGSVGAAECLARLDRLDEADAALALASARFPREGDILLAHARLAQQRKLWAEALTRWQTALRHAPANPEAMAGVAEALHGLDRGEEAARFLAQLATRPSADLAPRIEQAQACEARGDTRGAYDHWLAVIEAFPGSAEGLAGAGMAAIRLGRLHEADGLLARGLTMHPAHATLAVEHARVAQFRADWPEALRRYHHVLARFPGRAEGFAGGGLALSMLGRGGEADELLRRGMELFPRSAPVAVEYARVAQVQANWPEALRRWEQVMAKFPEDPEGPAGAATALRHLKRFAMLEQLLGAAVARFPAHAGLAGEHARAAQARQDWAEARQRWQAAQVRFPDDPAIRDGLRALATAEFNARLTSVDEGVAAVPAAPSLHQPTSAPQGVAAPNLTADPPVAPPSNEPAAPHRDLMMRFESLGSGCEFGAVQRQFGAEPISLLRWAAISVQGLVKGLDTGFADAGDPAHVRLFEWLDSRTYFFRDDFYDMQMHTFVHIQGTDHDRLLAQLCRRVKYLAAKLVDGLEAPPLDYGKIFVYKEHYGNFSEADVAALHGALLRFGEHPLLYIRPPDAAHPDGTVQLRGRGLMIGHIEGLSPTSNVDEIRYDAWLRVCTAADRLWRDQAKSTVLMRRTAVPGAIVQPANAGDGISVRPANVMAAQSGSEDAGTTGGSAMLNRVRGVFGSKPEVELPYQSRPKAYAPAMEPALTEQQLSPAAAATPPIKALGADDLALPDLMMYFESLGSGCEFGIVQRHYGAEPISLLRWGQIPAPSLAAALDARFRGVGDPERVSLYVIGDLDEYFFHDTMYGVQMHTFVPSSGTDYDRLLAQQCRRVKYLAGKLIEGLESGAADYDRIFVYKPHEGDLTEYEIALLHSAIRQFGDHTLLCARPPDSTHPDGSVELRAPGLLIGRIDGLSPNNDVKKIKYDTWLKVCKAAYTLWRGHESVVIPEARFAALSRTGPAELEAPVLAGIDIPGFEAAAALPAEGGPVRNERPARSGIFGRLFGGRAVRVAPDKQPASAPETQMPVPVRVAEPVPSSGLLNPLVANVAKARALFKEKRHAEAEAVVAEVLKQDPNNNEMLRMYAHIAESREQHAAAASRWDAVRMNEEKVAGAVRPDAFNRAIASYGKSGQHDRAEALSAIALERFYDNPFIAIVTAYAAQFAGNWPLAQRRWERARDVAPDLPDGWLHGARSCMELRQHEAALELLRIAEWKFPQHQVAVQKSIAYAAEARQDWKEAVRVWRVIESLAPDDGEVSGGLKRATYQVRMTEVDEAADNFFGQG